jgi:nifR3 family TIM-barrel protein
MTIKPLKIGNVTIEFPVILAPMAGYTDPVMRMLCRRYGCGLTYTEVVNAEGIVRGQKPTMHILETAPGESPVVAHIYGVNPETMAKAAAIIEKLGRFQLIDINCGCPVRKIVAKGAGAALMKNPEKIFAIVKAVKGACTLPVTVKTRIGFSPNRMNIMEIGHGVEEAGGDAIAIHVRFASQRHIGKADWETLTKIKSELKIPVIGNGGVDVAADAPRMFAETGVDGVMIGRAAVGNPWIFSEIRALMTGESYTPHSAIEHRAVIQEHILRLAKLKELERQCLRRKSRVNIEESTALHFRSHLVGYLKGYRGFGEIRRNFQSLRTIQDVMAAVDKVLSNIGRQEHRMLNAQVAETIEQEE